MNNSEVTSQPGIEETNPVMQLDREGMTPFLIVSGAWLILGLGFSAWFSDKQPFQAVAWMTFLWALCLFDLYALSRAVGAALGLAAITGEKRGALTIQAFYWGVIKLTCLGILGTILSYGRSIPTSSLLMGSGTLVVVPLLGGYWWSQKVLRHA